MTSNGGAAGKDLPAKKKSPFAGCLTIFAIFVALMIVLSIVSSNNEGKKREAAAVEASQAAERFKQVDSATESKVKAACVQQVNAVAKNAAREIAGVKPKYYTITATSFQGTVERVDLPYKKTAYEVGFTYEATHKDGTVNSTSRTCRVNPAFDFVELRP
jgi:hypothetical protein